MQLHRVFVYGTLKSGQPNHVHMESLGCHLVAAGHTEQAFPLVITSRWNLPFLLHVPGKGHQIYGEVYDVDDEGLEWLDQFEGHPLVYERDLVRVRMPLHADMRPNHEQLCECWVYFLKSFEPSMLQLEMHSSYDSYGEHNRPYLPEKDDSSTENFHVGMRQTSLAA